MPSVRSVISCLVVALPLLLAGCGPHPDEQLPSFNVWATSCCHVPIDRQRGRESLVEAIRQSEDPELGFAWDIMIGAGDIAGHQLPPTDADGREWVKQLAALTRHRREQIYNVQGNHDAGYYDQGVGTWFQKWVDPMGQHTATSMVDAAARPFPASGTWERYSFQAGNILFLMLSDRNDAPAPVGRGHSSENRRGGFPAGAVTRATFDWWKEQVLENQDKILITVHHHALRDTTVGSGKGEGFPRYHGKSGGGEGSSYLYYLIENEDPENFEFSSDAYVFESFLNDFYVKHGRGAIDCWIAGHTHVKGPEDHFGEKTTTEVQWGVNFLQSAALTRYHAGSYPMSRLLSFPEGKPFVFVKTYLHQPFSKKHPVGFYKPGNRKLTLRHAVKLPARR